MKKPERWSKEDTKIVFEECVKLYEAVPYSQLDTLEHRGCLQKATEAVLSTDKHKDVYYLAKRNLLSKKRVLAEVRRRKKIADNLKGKSAVPKSYFEQIKRSHLYRIANGKFLAENFDIDFNITLEYVSELFTQQNRRCALTGRLLHFKETSYEPGNASLDRKDSKLGYLIGNVQWVHKHVNKCKADFSDGIFIEICKDVYNFKFNNKK